MTGEVPLPTQDDLLAKLKSEGFFDEIRKRILENVEDSADFHYTQRSINGIVSRFLSCQIRPTSQQKKFEQREALRRELRGEAFLQRSIRQMADSLIAKHTSPEDLAPTFNKLACEAVGVDYQDWLEFSKQEKGLLPSPAKAAPLLPSPTSSGTHFLPCPARDMRTELKRSQQTPEAGADDENASLSDAVEMEVDNDGDEMEIESTDSNHSLPPPRPPPSQSAPQEQPIRTPLPDAPPQPLPLVTTSVNTPDNSVPSPSLNSSVFARRLAATVKPPPPAPLSAGSVNPISDAELDSPFSRRQKTNNTTGTASTALDEGKNPSPAKALFQDRTRTEKQQQHRQQHRSNSREGSQHHRQRDRYHRGDSQTRRREDLYAQRGVHNNTYNKGRSSLSFNHGGGGYRQDNNNFNNSNNYNQRRNQTRRLRESSGFRRDSDWDFDRRSVSGGGAVGSKNNTNRLFQHQNRNQRGGIRWVGENAGGLGYHSRNISPASSSASRSHSRGGTAAPPPVEAVAATKSPSQPRRLIPPPQQSPLMTMTVSVNPNLPQRRRRQSSPHSSIPDPVGLPLTATASTLTGRRNSFNTERRGYRKSPHLPTRWNDNSQCSVSYNNGHCSRISSANADGGDEGANVHRNSNSRGDSDHRHPHNTHHRHRQSSNSQASLSRKKQNYPD